MILATANHVFGWDLWGVGGYPALVREDQSAPRVTSYGNFMLQVGSITLGAMLLGTFLMYRLRVRYERTWALLEAIRSEGYAEALQADGGSQAEWEEEEQEPKTEPEITIEALEEKYGSPQ